MSGAETEGRADPAGRGGASHRPSGGALPPRPGAPGIALKIAPMLGLGLALLEMAAILSQPGVSRASASDLVVLASWLAIPYALALGLASAVCAVVLARVAGHSFAGAFAGAGTAMALTFWLRTLARLGSAGRTRIILEALILLVALGAGTACGMAAGRIASRKPRPAAGTSGGRTWATRVIVVAAVVWVVWGGREFLHLLDAAPPPAAGPDHRRMDSANGALPNVLLISIDTLRADHLSCYGYPEKTSPAIDQLAAEGVLFTKTASTVVRQS